MSQHRDPELLIFEPQIVGHRLTWLEYITEDFLDFGYKITWAVDLRPEVKHIIQERLAPLLNKISVLSIFNEQNRWRGGCKINAIAECLKISGVKQVFINELDDVASNVLRKASLGIYPPPALRGNLSGVYFRPRFLSESAWQLNNRMKASGFRRLLQQKWFRHVYLVDEYLISSPELKSTGHFHFLPDPWSGDYRCSATDAKMALDIPLNKFVLLHYGIGDRRKGLHLAIAALEKTPHDAGIFLLCAGQINLDQTLLKRIDALEKKGMAKLINRYVSNEEECTIFCSVDAVLLPYIHHSGSSGVLSRAAAAGKMVIVSDEGLLAKRVREHDLGLLFPTTNIHALQKCMIEASLMHNEKRAQFHTNLIQYGKICSRESFRNALLAPWRLS